MGFLDYEPACMGILNKLGLKSQSDIDRISKKLLPLKPFLQFN